MLQANTTSTLVLFPKKPWLHLSNHDKSPGSAAGHVLCFEACHGCISWQTAGTTETKPQANGSHARMPPSTVQAMGSWHCRLILQSQQICQKDKSEGNRSGSVHRAFSGRATDPQLTLLSKLGVDTCVAPLLTRIGPCTWKATE